MSDIVDFDSFDPDCQTIDDVGRGGGLSTPGRYLVQVIDIDDGTEPGAPIVPTLQVVSGMPASAIGQTFRNFFNQPLPTHKDGGKMCLHRKARFYVVTGLLTNEMIQQRQVAVEAHHAVGRQFVCDVIVPDRDDGKQYAEIDGMKMWAVNDPAVAEIVQGANGQAATGQAAPQAAPATAAAPAGQPAAQPAPAAVGQSDVERFGNL